MQYQRSLTNTIFITHPQSLSHKIRAVNALPSSALAQVKMAPIQINGLPVLAGFMDGLASPPQNVLDRQIEAFQFKIQQTLNLRDEEIERLSIILNTTKSQILEAKETLKELDRQIQEAKDQKLGSAKRRKAEASTRIARIKRAHHQQVKDLQDQQTMEINELQASFETEIGRVSAIVAERREEEAAKIDEEMERVRTQTQTYLDEVAKMQEEERSRQMEIVDGLQSVDNEVIEELQYIVQQRNTERFENLRQSRDKLKHCVETLDAMTRSHAADLGERQRRLREIESKYEIELGRIEDMHAHRVAMLKGHLVEATKRAAVLMRASHHLERSNQQQLKGTIRDLAAMKRRAMANTDRPMVRPEDGARIQNLNRLADKHRRVMESKDEQLRQVREANDRLKSDVWRVRHDLKYREIQRALADG